MQFKWIKGSTAIPAITFYDNNVTLNNAAANFFTDSKYAMLGIDYDSNTVAIKPVKKRELDLKLHDVSSLNKVSMGRGYARISNKQFIEEVKTLLARSMNGIKFEAVFNEKEGILLVDLKKGEISL